jgi:hypothetical protein
MAGKTEPYKKLVKQYALEKGPDAVLFCSRCHTPLIAMAGLLDNPDDPSQNALRDEGISCQYCHLIDAVSPVLANGLVTLNFPRTHLDQYQLNDPRVRKIRDRFLTANLMPHRNAFKRPVHTTTEFCAACHRVDMNTSLNGKPLVLGDTHSPWLESESRDKGITCQFCHLPLTTVTRNPNSSWHAAGDHRFSGTCQSLALLVPGEKDLDKYYDEVVEQRLQGKLEIPAYENFYLALFGRPMWVAYNRYLKNQRALSLLHKSISGFFFKVADF